MDEVINKEESWWNKDEFSDLVEKALIISSEKYKSGVSWGERLTPSESRIIRSIGPYFSPYVYQVKSDGYNPTIIQSQSHKIDLCHESKFIEISYKKPIPYFETIISNSYLSTQNSKEQEKNLNEGLKNLIFSGKASPKGDLMISSNMAMSYIRQSYDIPKKQYKIQKNKGYIPYILYMILGRDEGGMLIDKCPFQINHEKGTIRPILNMSYFNATLKHGDECFVYHTEYSYIQSFTLILNNIEVYQRDKNLWKVKAIEDGYSSKFGVHEEQIKSLFYSADTGKTSTGRKKPIIHWIKEHQRRLRDGISVTTIPKSLRGENKLRMGNTTFEIFPTT